MERLVIFWKKKMQGENLVVNGLVDEIDRQVGKNLRIARKAGRLTQRQLAAHIGVTYQQYNKYESGKNRISASRLYKACRQLNIGVETLFEGIDDQQPNTMESDPEGAAQTAQLLFLCRKIQSKKAKENALFFLKTFITS